MIPHIERSCHWTLLIIKGHSAKGASAFPDAKVTVDVSTKPIGGRGAMPLRIAIAKPNIDATSELVFRERYRSLGG